MSKVARQWAERQQIADSGMKGVLLQLAYMHREGVSPYPSQKTLAKVLGKSPRAVFTALRLLEMAELVKRKRRSNGAHGRGSDQFDLNLDRDFVITKPVAVAMRKALSKSHILQVAKIAVPTRNNGERLEGDQQNLAIGKTLDGEIGDTREQNAPPAPFRVLTGGRVA